MRRTTNCTLFAITLTAVCCGGASGRIVCAADSPPAAIPTNITFDLDVQPLLTRYGCNAGACHGKSRGQNGFALSLLGFDPNFDHEAIAREARGRRVFPAAPEESLLLRKATATIPHGGGRRLELGSPFYET